MSKEDGVVLRLLSSDVQHRIPIHPTLNRIASGLDFFYSTGFRMSR
jgi:hypothetical protein